MVCEGEIAGRFYLIKHCNFKNEIMHAEKFLQLKSANLVTVFFFFLSVKVLFSLVTCWLLSASDEDNSVNNDNSSSQ